MDKFIILLLCCFNIFFIKTIKKSWFNLAFVYTVVWSFFVVASLFFLSNDYQWHWGGMYWISISCTFIIMGQWIGATIISRKRKKIVLKEEANQYAISWKMVIAAVVIGCVGVLYTIYLNGFGITDFIHLERLLEMNKYNAYERYYGSGQRTNLLSQLSLFIVYVNPLIGGYCMPYADNKKQYGICIASIIPVIGLMFFNNTKAGFIACVINWCIAFFVSNYQKNRKYIKINLKFVWLALGIVIIFLLSLFVIMCIRIGGFSEEIIAIVQRKFINYAFGGIKAFDEWYYFSVAQAQLEWGVNTFMSIFDQLGIVNRIQGVYTYAQNSNTNIFTIFRGIISDFGIIGGQIFIFVTGIIGGMSYKLIEVSKKMPAFFTVILCSLFFMYLYGFIISPWIYTSYLCSFIIFYIFLKFGVKKIQGEKL